MKASDIVALPLQLGSAVRQRRVFHPMGVLASGRIERVAPPDEGLPIESTDILVRVSKLRGASAPEILSSSAFLNSSRSSLLWVRQDDPVSTGRLRRPTAPRRIGERHWA